MHFLQKSAKRTKRKISKYPSNAKYNFIKGVWQYNDGCLVIEGKDGPCTKKEDIETGEDQKGF
ncbi:MULTISPECIES: hypothetical protein [unclassified Commensalibacter]|uniref:hypothetical protein n=1 Tax=unclassified Commensalibacter TaxID=2630218 RepID=UPI0018DE7983|nr:MULTISPECIES: hypothetical protein [unclassified Commensalibacter]MBH9970503.1 hypothetical protein [Commensalibacter sp. M0265]MBH9977802.1 hypothetical protein [Commensalibacter sp. M0266]MBH9993538.1 hypothetical protein [Commensalibacter sp. M0270]MBI0047034.1 hypothetical protein [Commensalibacter sp. M0267]MBI0056703.1 hypothetical protein [Commensalibacter sp. M0268]